MPRGWIEQIGACVYNTISIHGHDLVLVSGHLQTNWINAKHFTYIHSIFVVAVREHTHQFKVWSLQQLLDNS